MPTKPITLGQLATAVAGRVVGDETTLVSDVTHDSRMAGSGDLFVAIRGFTVDGHAYVESALESGAAVCVDHEPAVGDGPGLVVGDTRAALGVLAAEVHGRPSEDLPVVGITGTNGKTTITHLLEGVGRAAGLKPSIAGTVGARIDGEDLAMGRTTPEASDFQRLLAAMRDRGSCLAAVEVSSHALTLGRVGATRFRVGAFTNLSRDHLDFHPDMEAYFEAKRKLFAQSDVAVVWIDDPWGKRLAAELDIPVVTVAATSPAVLKGTTVRSDLTGSTLDIESPEGSWQVSTRLAGDFNAANTLVACACAEVLGVDTSDIASGIASVPEVPGRFEVVPTDADATVVVDYAHTPDGVESVIAATRRLASNSRIITVVGAGGDRDRSKRPLMGAAATTADFAVITSDNPRSEDPDMILSEVVAGISKSADFTVEPDRRRAIRLALEAAGSDDVVLVLGKGHEQGQDFGDTTVPFDDRMVVVEEAGSR